MATEQTKSEGNRKEENKNGKRLTVLSHVVDTLSMRPELV